MSTEEKNQSQEMTLRCAVLQFTKITFSMGEFLLQLSYISSFGDVSKMFVQLVWYVEAKDKLY